MRGKRWEGKGRGKRCKSREKEHSLTVGEGMGIVAGILSTLGFKYLTPLLNNKFGLQDICGIHNLHAMVREETSERQGEREWNRHLIVSSSSYSLVCLVPFCPSSPLGSSITRRACMKREEKREREKRAERNANK